MLIVDIHKKLGAFQLNSSFTCNNEKLALLGASGCGKSMTLKMIAGIVKPDSGHIELNGRVLFDSSRHINLPPQKRKVGLLFQQYALFPNMTAEMNIRQGAKQLPPRLRAPAAEEMLRAFRLEKERKLYPSQLSGGQQQRTALARILIGKPELLLLDEPFSALDSYLRWQLELELTDILKDYGGDVILVSHNRDEVCRFSEQVCVLTNGQTEQKEPVSSLMKMPGTVGSALISGCKNYSRAKKLDEHTVLCEDWGVTMHTEQEVPEALTYAGVRAHNLTPGSGENELRCGVERVIDNVFSYIILLSTPGGSKGLSMLRMELSKQAWQELHEPDTITVSVASRDVMPLTGEGNIISDNGGSL